MNRRVLMQSTICAAFLLGGCGERQNATVRFRVIVKVEVDGQPVESSSVMEITYSKVTGSIIGTGGATTTKGEAVIVDLKGRGTVFVLPVELQRSGSLLPVYEGGLLQSLGIEEGIGTLRDESFERLRQARGRIPLWVGSRNAPSRLPLFVAFADTRTPRTIYEVDPRNMARHFPSARFVGIDLEFTRDPITRELTKRLPWVGDVRADPGWEGEPAGSKRPMSEWPLGYKIRNHHFFGNGSP